MNLPTTYTEQELALRQAAEDGDIETLKRFVEEGADTHQLTMALERACWGLESPGSHLSVEYLAGQGAKFDIAGEAGHTPLFGATCMGKFDVAETLVRLGANVSAALAYGPTPLWFAAQQGYLEIVKLLHRHGANLFVVDSSGCTTLWNAARHGRAHVVEFLIENGQDMSTAERHGKTPLYVASEFGHIEVVECLINHGADVSTANEFGKTPLHVAAERGSLSVVKFLLEHGADVSAVDMHGRTALDFVKRKTPPWDLLFRWAKSHEFAFTLSRGNLLFMSCAAARKARTLGEIAQMERDELIPRDIADHLRAWPWENPAGWA